MTKAYLKSILRSVQRSFSRFISIVIIIALGLAFFVGIKATAPDMRQTAQDYFVYSNLMDIRVQSSIGLTDEDVQAIHNIDPNIEAVIGQKFKDALVLVNGEIEKDIDGTQISTRVYGINTGLLANYINYGVNEAAYMNRPMLLEGEYPDAPNECLVDASALSTPDSFQIGSTITLVGDNEDLRASLKETEFTIVGIIQTPYYISFERGNTLIGSGKVGTFIIVPDSVFVQDYYTELYVKIVGSDGYDAFSDEYRNYIAPYLAMIKAIAPSRLEARVTNLQQTLPDKIAEAENLLSDASAEAGSQLQELKNTIKTLEESKKLLTEQLAKAQETYNVTLADAEEELALNRIDYDQNLTQYNSLLAQYQTNSAAYAEQNAAYTTAYAEYSANLQEYNTAYNSYKQAQTQVKTTNTMIAETEALLTMLDNRQNGDFSSDEMAAINKFLQTTYPGLYEDLVGSTTAGLATELAAYARPILQQYKAELIVQEAELAAIETQLNTMQSELAAANVTLTSTKQQLDSAEIELTAAYNQLLEYSKELSSAGTEITSSDFQLSLQKIQTQMMITELTNQLETIETNLTTAQAALQSANAQLSGLLANETGMYQQQLDNAKKLLESLNNVYWNIYDRYDTPGYSSFSSTTKNLEVLANIFPIFFFIVAALVCLTTMTRMIDEDRTTLGTLKALGYDNKTIAAKYIIYSLSACVLGCTFAIVLGMYIFPFAIFKAYSIMFTIPALQYTLPIGSSVVGIVIALLCTLVVTLVALRRDLAEVPAMLMRAKAPKAGKRILLENVNFIWRRMRFTNKVTARNLFRNKQRLFMTVIGIAGCSALMLASLGMYNSVSAIRSKQYGENAISHYDFQVMFDSAQDGTSGEYKTVANSNSVSSTLLISMKAVTGYSLRTDAQEDVYLLSPSDPALLADYITLQNRSTGKIYVPSIAGALISEKFAKDTNTKVGETVFIQTSDAKTYEIFVAGIVENYTFHYIYISPDYYAELFGAYPSYDYCLGNLTDAVRSADEETLASLKGQMATKLMSQPGIQAVSFTSDVNDSLAEITNALTAVVAVFFLSALILAFVVLYNLTNINILERNRELATLKVLGFLDNEVHAYVLKENIILTAFGTAFGMGLGIVLHYLLITYAEIDTVMFGRTIEWFSFLIAIVLTFAFAALVNAIVNRKLKHIDMAMSLKSVE
ncbi:MAG: FtsX-like permease family protein [Clostridia bacterium]|nr:FtsX-like permease family protein [Clostridia bacterium]